MGLTRDFSTAGRSSTWKPASNSARTRCSWSEPRTCWTRIRKSAHAPPRSARSTASTHPGDSTERMSIRESRTPGVKFVVEREVGAGQSVRSPWPAGRRCRQGSASEPGTIDRVSPTKAPVVRVLGRWKNITPLWPNQVEFGHEPQVFLQRSGRSCLLSTMRPDRTAGSGPDRRAAKYHFRIIEEKFDRRLTSRAPFAALQGAVKSLRCPHQNGGESIRMRFEAGRGPSCLPISAHRPCGEDWPPRLGRTHAKRLGIQRFVSLSRVDKRSKVPADRFRQVDRCIQG